MPIKGILRPSLRVAVEESVNLVVSVIKNLKIEIWNKKKIISEYRL